MSARQFHPNNSESFTPDMLPNNDFLMDDTMAQWTNDASYDMFSSQAEAACGVSGNDNWAVPNGAFDLPVSQYQLPQDDTFDSLFLPQIGSPQAVAGAQELPSEQVNVSIYPENPSLTAGSWVWVPETTVTSQCNANPSLFGGINIDPALLALDPPGTFNPVSTPQLPDVQPREPSFKSASRDAASSTGSPPALPSRKRKQHPTIDAPTPDAPRITKRSKVSKPAPKGPSLTAPLSILPACAHIPLKDVAAHVKRPARIRRTDAAYSRNRKNQAIPRPSNSFMLYRMAYTDRIQALSREADNHQVVSSVAGESWRMETEQVREEFAQLAEVEKVQHEKAWPDYRYQPNIRG